jgi:hypothetical protein
VNLNNTDGHRLLVWFIVFDYHEKNTFFICVFNIATSEVVTQKRGT